MPKVKTTLACRVSEFRNEGMEVFDKTMRCKHCNCRVDWEKRDTVQKHCEGKKHKDAKLKAQTSGKRQSTFEEANKKAKKNKEDKEEFIEDTVEAFLKSNIPMNKLDEPALRAWTNKYIKGAGDLPVAKHLREKWIPIVANKSDEVIKEELRGKNFLILSDEHQDKGGRCVFNVLAQTLEPSTEQKIFLLGTSILDAANSANCSRAILDTLQKYDKHIDEVTAFNADSARYMTKCFKTLQGLHEELLHIQCWPHKLHNAGNTFQKSLPELNHAVASTKKIFLLSRKRKNLYLNFLAEKYPNNPEKVKLFPIPVITRWGSWKLSVDYLSEYFDDICEFLGDNAVDDECDDPDDDATEKESSNRSVKWLQELGAGEEKIKVYSEYVSTHCQPMKKLIFLLQKNTLPTGHLVYEKLDTIERKFDVLRKGEGNEKFKFFNSLSAQKQKEYLPALKEAALKCHTDLRRIGTNDPARPLLGALHLLLSPSSLTKHQLSAEIIGKHMKEIPFVKKLTVSSFMEGQKALMDLAKEEVKRPDFKFIDVMKLLCTLKTQYLEFSNACLKAIWISPSNAESERSVSAYNVVVTDRRRRLKPQNAEILTKTYFNKRNDNIDFGVLTHEYEYSEV